MIEFHFESDFVLEKESIYSDWVSRILMFEGFNVGQIDFIFCADEYLLKLNKQYLQHDTYTDIITFDYTKDKTVSGDIFISTQRVIENAEIYGTTPDDEMLRVMSHGILHLMGYGDKSEKERIVMRAKEEEKIKMFHVEQ
ncbi:rRNA maturation RNase YbeY [Flagellimonas meishanensis]|uniref:rRNA maturation RNase YbeY n=1 Tax=Flagellimonas meishanensis TaxID=2873264 RepID=UPI001CA63456|nr:rRNA maturation RNase YbeY [[Muricauda] meishanensis]